MRNVTFALTCLVCAALAVPSRAQISFLDMFHTVTYWQTGNGNPGNPTGDFLSMRLFYTSIGDFTDASANGPGPITPVTLGPDSPTDRQYVSAAYPTLAAMNSDFPFGTYTYTGLGGTRGPESATLDYTADVYPAAQPFLTGTDYSTLQGVDTATPLTLHFSPFATNPAVDFQFQFFTIFDTTLNTFVYNAGFLPSSSTGVTLAANTLLAGHNYLYELIDSNRVLTTGTGGQFSPQLGFDLRTSGAFFAAPAAVPEPAPYALLATSVFTGAIFLRRRKTARVIA